MLRNSTERRGWPAKTLHWIGAILILLLLGMAGG
jgi:cytochrome b561